MTPDEFLDSITATRPAYPIRPTGLGSLDYALGGGIEDFSKVEIAGPSYSGKTTLSMALAARLSAPKGRVLLCDLEGKGNGVYAMQAARATKGWDGELWVSPFEDKKGTVTQHVDRVDASLAEIDKTDTTALVLDSIGAYTTVRETEGSVEDANIGKAAIAIKTMYRIMMRKLEARPDHPFYFFGVNHLHPNIGGQGSETSGGKAPQYYSDYRMRVWATKDSDVWTINGSIVKRRAPGTDDFWVEMIPSEGIHWGLTAVQDCCRWKLAKLERTVSFNGKSYGYYSKMVKDRSDPELFAPFLEASANYVKEKWG